MTNEQLAPDLNILSRYNNERIWSNWVSSAIGVGALTLSQLELWQKLNSTELLVNPCPLARSVPLVRRTRMKMFRHWDSSRMCPAAPLAVMLIQLRLYAHGYFLSSRYQTTFTVRNGTHCALVRVPLLSFPIPASSHIMLLFEPVGFDGWHYLNLISIHFQANKRAAQSTRLQFNRNPIDWRLNEDNHVMSKALFSFQQLFDIRLVEMRIDAFKNRDTIVFQLV